MNERILLISGPEKLVEPIKAVLIAHNCELLSESRTTEPTDRYCMPEDGANYSPEIIVAFINMASSILSKILGIFQRGKGTQRTHIKVKQSRDSLEIEIDAQASPKEVLNFCEEITTILERRRPPRPPRDAL